MQQDEARQRLLTIGRSRFIWTRGVLGWGVTTAVLFAAVMAWSREMNLGMFLVTLGIALVLFPAGGFVWGALMWRLLVEKGMAAGTGGSDPGPEEESSRPAR